MTEYVEREAIIEALAKDILNDPNCPLFVAATVQQIVDLVPAADVQEVRHGKWAGTVCTNCGESTSDYYDCDYCPKCGTKMDLG